GRWRRRRRRRPRARLRHEDRHWLRDRRWRRRRRRQRNRGNERHGRRRRARDRDPSVKKALLALVAVLAMGYACGDALISWPNLQKTFVVNRLSAATNDPCPIDGELVLARDTGCLYRCVSSHLAFVVC